MGRVGSGTGSGRCFVGWASNRTGSKRWWTSTMRWNIWARSRPYSGGGPGRSVRNGLDASDDVQAAIDEVCGPRASQALKRERNYFKRNAGQKRMAYARIAALKLPIGSGAIESTIRRVVNLRLKGASIYSL